MTTQGIHVVVTGVTQLLLLAGREAKRRIVIPEENWSFK